MSLVGSLEDLGLGDILQIVSLSRKSGLLLLRSDEGDGRIAFENGLVRAAYAKGEPEDLRSLLVPGAYVDAEEFDRAVEAARAGGPSAEEGIAQRTGLTLERIHSLRREHVERTVLRMFSWRVGEFSFEMRDGMDPRDQELALPTGINPQYLTIEATRLGDEAGGDAPEPGADDPIDDEDDDGFVLSGEEDGPDLAAAVAEEASLDPSAAGPREASPAGAGGCVPLVVIDPELRALEWVKSMLQGAFARVHIFQHSEGGIGRIRQYLTRGTMPVVLVSASAPADSLSGTGDVAELLGRLRGQAPRMPVLVMHDGSGETPAGVDAADLVVVRPSCATLSDRRRSAEVEAVSQQLRSALAPWAAPAASARADAAKGEAAQGSTPELRRLKQVSEQLRHPGSRGDVVNVVLDFAAECFRRVAIFMVRDEFAVGLAQRGLEAAGGPDDAALRRLQVPLEGPRWFRAAIEGREALCTGPGDEGDRLLAAALGDQAAREAYVAPIVSGSRVAAILYADNLPEEATAPDATALAIVLHEAGLALDQALLERALAELGDADSER